MRGTITITIDGKTDRVRLEVRRHLRKILDGRKDATVIAKGLELRPGKVFHPYEDNTFDVAIKYIEEE